MRNYTNFRFILILAPFALGFPFGLDICIPIVPQMTQIFNTSPALVHLTLSLFLFTMGLGQLFIGPLSDQLGRKTVLYLSSACYFLGALSCSLSTHIVWLLFARFLNGVGACGMYVTAFAILRDLFSDKKNAKMFSFLRGINGISPILAPLLGGYLSLFLGWQSIFLFLALHGCLTFFITHRFVDETLTKEKHVKINLAIFKRYTEIISHRLFLTHALLASFAGSLSFCFFSISPYIIIHLLGIPEYQFGYYFAVYGVVVGAGGFISGKLIDKFGVTMAINLGILVMIAGGVSMLIWHYLAGLSLIGFLIPMVISCTGAMLVGGGSPATALEPFGHIAGTALAALGAFEFILPAVIGSLLMLFPITSTVSYGVLIVVMGTLSFSLFMLRPKAGYAHVG